MEDHFGAEGLAGGAMAVADEQKAEPGARLGFMQGVEVEIGSAEWVGDQQI